MHEGFRQMGSSGQNAGVASKEQPLGAAEMSGASLLRMSLGGRLAVAAFALAILWSGVLWALS
jgi:hypothetical protein